MAESAVSFVLESLSHLIVEEIELLYKVKDEIESIRPELQMMQCFLKDADARQHKEETVKQWVKEIKSISYRIEDALETYAIKVESMKGKGIRKKIRRVFAFAEELFIPHEVVIEIKAIKSRISVLNKMLETYGVYNMAEERSSSINEAERWLDKIPFNEPADDFVGMEAEITLLVYFMVEAEKNCPVISICGMGGTGKTALAREVFNHSSVRVAFDDFAWVYVGQKFQRRKILEGILTQLVPGVDDNGVSLIEDLKLAQKLNEILRKKKCLVILDDIWSLDAWEHLRVAFPFGNTSSKILVTTRMREVAELAAREGYIHTMRHLTEEESWELFKRKAFSRAGPDFQVHAMMEEMGRQMVSRCRGLPLAIDMIGSLMATKHTLREWEIVHQNTDSYLNAEGISEIPQVLASSFYDLPYRLKPCFLYLGYFPEESDIEVEKLYLLWIAEGIIESEDSGMEETVMEIADRYLMELEVRSLVEVQKEEVPTVSRFKSCSLHGLMRQLCLTKGKEDEFLKVIDFGRGSQLASDSSASDYPPRRLVICLDKYEDVCPVPLILQTAAYIKCLLIYSTHENQQQAVLPRELSELSKFKVLKTLDFDGLDFRKMKLPRGISKLIRLRYLSFKGCVLDYLPFEIGSLSYLLVLDLRVRPWCEMIIPNVLRKLKRLMHLYLPESFRTDTHRMLQLDGLTELETLKQFKSNVCNVKDLSEMINLRYLTSCTEGRVEDLESIINRMNMTTEHILYSSVDVRNFDCYTEERHSVFRQLLCCRVLRTISMEGHIGQIPPYHKISESLMEIVFSGSQLKEDPMQVFEKLPNLRVLVLNDDAFLGAEMVCSAISFCELRRLELLNLHYLEKWKIEKGSLVNLTTLAIENCSRLERLPDGVKFVSNLKNLHIRRMPRAFEERLRVVDGTMGEDLQNVQQVTSITFDD